MTVCLLFAIFLSASHALFHIMQHTYELGIITPSSIWGNQKVHNDGKAWIQSIFLTITHISHYYYLITSALKEHTSCSGNIAKRKALPTFHAHLLLPNVPTDTLSLKLHNPFAIISSWWATTHSDFSMFFKFQGGLTGSVSRAHTS